MLKRYSILAIVLALAVLAGACSNEAVEPSLPGAQNEVLQHANEHLLPGLPQLPPPGTYPIGGPIIDISGGLPTTGLTDMRDAGVIAINGGNWWKVNELGTEWQRADGHIVAATEPTTGLFTGMLWYDTTSDTPKFYDGTNFQEITTLTLSDHDPEQTGTANPGVSTQASRSDHVHFSAGGGSATADGVANAVDLTITNSTVGIEIDRSGTLSSLTDTLDIRPNGSVTPEELNSTNTRVNGYIYGNVNATTGEWIAPPPRTYSDLTGNVPVSAIPASIARTASPTFTGNPTAPTPSASDNDTTIATTAFVQTELGDYATLASPSLSGNPTAPTASSGDNDTSIATTAFVTTAVAGAGGGIIIQDSGTQEGTGIGTVNFGQNLDVAVSGGVATITGQSGGGGTTYSAGNGLTLTGNQFAADYGATAPGDVVLGTGTGSAGTATTLSRSDHTHGGKAVDTHRGQYTSTPDTVAADTGDAGVSMLGARGDHDHGLDSTVTARLLPTGATNDQIARYDTASSSWMAEDLPSAGAGITQAQADARYSQLAAENTFTDKQTINAGSDGPGLLVTTTGNNGALRVEAPGTTGQTVMVLQTNSTGTQKAFQAGRVGESTSWASFEGSLGGANANPGLAFGPGTSSRDVNLYRGGDDILRTDDSFIAEVLDVHGTLATTQSNLGIVTTWQGLGNTPSAIVAGQCVQGATGGQALTFGACGSGSGASTFTGLSDTPSSYASVSGYITRVNSAGDALEFSPYPTNTNTIPHVGRIPAVTATSPDLIFLTHDEIDGNRDDATLTIGRDAGNSCGYSDGSIYAPAFGSISEPSPLTTIFGIWNSTDSNCDLAEIFSNNEGWVDDQQMAVGMVSGTAFTCNLGTRFNHNGQHGKRFTSCGALENLPLGDISINFLTGDTPPDPYWTDGETTHPAGLYEKVGTPQMYHDIRPIEESHRQGQGSFACGEGEPPDDGGQVCIDSDGRASFSTDRVILIENAPTIDMVALLDTDYFTGADTGVLNFNNTAADGEFKWSLVGEIFFQMQGNRATATLRVTGTDNLIIPEGAIFVEDGASTLIRTTALGTISGGMVIVPVEAMSDPGAAGNNVSPTATFTLQTPMTGVDDSAILEMGFTGGVGQGLTTPTWTQMWTYIASIDGSDTAAEQALHNSLASNSVFLGEFSLTANAAADRDGYTDATTRYFYNIHNAEDEILEITGFTAGTSENQDEHVWVGPVVTIEDVHDVFEVNADISPQAQTFSSLRVGDTLYTAIVRPNEETGNLRDPVAADWDNEGWSRSVAWDGAEWLEVERYFGGAHSADAEFTEIPTGTTFTFGGNTYRWRGSYTGGSPHINPQNRDFIYSINGHTLREYVVDSRGFSAGWQSISLSNFLARELNYRGAFPDQDGALAHISDDNDHVIYNRTPERARGIIRFTGTEGTDIPVGTRVTATGTSTTFDTIEGGTIPSTGMIDLDARATNGGSAGNVADATVFTHSLADVTNVVAFGAFTRGDDVSDGYRLFSVDNFTEATTAEITYRWVPLDYAEDLEEVVVPDHATGILRQPTAADYDLTHGQSAVIGFDGHNIYRVKRALVAANTASATFTEVPGNTILMIDDGSGTSSYRYRGVHYQDYQVDNPDTADIYLNRHNQVGHFRYYTNTIGSSAGWHNITVAAIGDHSWRGYFENENEALAHVTANGQYVAYGGEMYTVSAFVPPMPDHYEYVWEAIVPTGNALDPSDQSILDILHEREPADTTLTIAGLEEGGTLRGWDTNRGSLANGDHLDDDVTLIGYFTQQYPFQLEGRSVHNFFYMEVDESSTENKYVGARIRWTDPDDDEADEYSLERLDHISGTTRYVSTTQISYRPAIGDMVTFNLENPDREDIELFGGVPWQWHAERGGGGSGSNLADDSVTTGTIQDGAVTAVKIANDAVVPRTIDTTGSTDGQVLTSTGPDSDPAWEDATGGGGGTPAMLSGNTVEELYTDGSTAFTFGGGLTSSGSNARTVTLSRSLTSADVGKRIEVIIGDETSATFRTVMGVAATVTDQRQMYQFVVTADLLAGTEAQLVIGNQSNANVGWGGARITMPAANQLRFAFRMNISSQTVFQTVRLIPEVSHLSISGSGGSGLVKQFHMFSNQTENELSDGTWETIITHAITVAAATDRVYIDGAISVRAGGADPTCEVRVTRGSAQVGGVAQAGLSFLDQIENVVIRTIEAPGAGTFTYNIQARQNGGSSTCIANDENTTSFATIEVLGPNP